MNHFLASSEQGISGWRVLLLHTWLKTPVPYLEQRDVLQNVPVLCSENIVFLIRSTGLHNGIIITNIPALSRTGLDDLFIRVSSCRNFCLFPVVRAGKRQWKLQWYGANGKYVLQSSLSSGIVKTKFFRVFMEKFLCLCAWEHRPCLGLQNQLAWEGAGGAFPAQSPAGVGKSLAE